MMLRTTFLIITTLLSYCESQKVEQNTIIFEGNFEEKMQSDASIFKVDDFVDGDTFWVLDKDNNRVKIRLLGIDAPEVKTVFNKKKHPFGSTSKDYLDSLLTAHQYVKLTFDVDSLDRYGRTLAYAYLNDGTFLNELLVKNGYATMMTISPNIKYQDLFYEAQLYARDNRLGIWNESVE